MTNTQEKIKDLDKKIRLASLSGDGSLVLALIREKASLQKQAYEARGATPEKIQA